MGWGGGWVYVPFGEKKREREVSVDGGNSFTASEHQGRA